MKKVLFVFGTRPEAIKLVPLIRLFRASDRFITEVCVTAQHREMLDQVLRFFEIVPDHDLNLMTPNQSLATLSARALQALDQTLERVKPELVFVQGDTTTSMICALSCFYRKIDVVHVEAGLRSFNKYAPFPEEINRVLTGHIAKYHFAPTHQAVENLKREGIREHVFMVGNTVIDALFLGLETIRQKNIEGAFEDQFSFLDKAKRLILVTCHRRENFGEPFRSICAALRQIASEFPDTELIYPVHLNPNIKDVADGELGSVSNIHLVPPAEYPELIWLMNRSYLVLTDSGGIQEEAPSLGKPVLVLRDVTERNEGVDAGTAQLVGTRQERIVAETRKLLTDKTWYQTVANAVNPYGDGTSSRQILDTISGI
jgi:UDP-N-acetylglucosamine 2-epimerase (non-hydrolysing)